MFHCGLSDQTTEQEVIESFMLAAFLKNEFTVADPPQNNVDASGTKRCRCKWSYLSQKLKVTCRQWDQADSVIGSQKMSSPKVVPIIPELRRKTIGEVRNAERLRPEHARTLQTYTSIINRAVATKATMNVRDARK